MCRSHEKILKSMQGSFDERINDLKSAVSNQKKPAPWSAESHRDRREANDSHTESNGNVGGGKSLQRGKAGRNSLATVSASALVGEREATAVHHNLLSHGHRIMLCVSSCLVRRGGSCGGTPSPWLSL